MASTTAAPADDHLHLEDVQRRVKAIFIGSVGNLVEWYDFYAYAAFALYFAGAFFPGEDPVVQQLNAAVLFAIGFIVRPIGGWLFSSPAPQKRPRQELILSVVLILFWPLFTVVHPAYPPVCCCCSRCFSQAMRSEPGAGAFRSSSARCWRSSR